MENNTKSPRIAVVGGGLAGLTAALTAAEEGAQVVLLEGSQSPGGRAASLVEDGFRFNLGPHALYRLGAGREFLSAHGIDPVASPPAKTGGLAFNGGRLYKLPGTPSSLLATRLLGVSDKLQLVRVLARVPKMDWESLVGVSQREWIHGLCRSERVRSLLFAICRLTSYCNAPDQLDAGASLRQLQAALAGNVLYLDGGWQTMVDSLLECCVSAGVEISCGRRVNSISGRVGEYSLEIDGDQRREVDGVIVATTPGAASRLLEAAGSKEAQKWRSLLEIKAVCLDLGMSRLPEPRRNFALGVDRPLYFSVHSAVARLAPVGGALVHVARYLEPGEQGADGVEELERMLDTVQPGWREYVVQRRVLPQVTVSQAMVEVGDTRPRPEESGLEGVRLAGDWVGPEGMLADTAFASGQRAAKGLVEGLRAA